MVFSKDVTGGGEEGSSFRQNYCNKNMKQQFCKKDETRTSQKSRYSVTPLTKFFKASLKVFNLEGWSTLTVVFKVKKPVFLQKGVKLEWSAEGVNFKFLKTFSHLTFSSKKPI